MKPNTESSTPKLVVMYGWALAGKSTIADSIAAQTGMHFIDIDVLRFTVFGRPYPHPKQSDELMQADKAEMMGSYEMLFSAVRLNLQLGRSVIVCATFSRESYRDRLWELVTQHPGVAVKVIFCRPLHDDEQEIAHRITARRSYSTVNDLERYNEVKDRLLKLPALCEQQLELDTSASRPIADCVATAVAFIGRAEAGTR